MTRYVTCAGAFIATSFSSIFFVNAITTDAFARSTELEAAANGFLQCIDNLESLPAYVYDDEASHLADAERAPAHSAAERKALVDAARVLFEYYWSAYDCAEPRARFNVVVSSLGSTDRKAAETELKKEVIDYAQMIAEDDYAFGDFGDDAPSSQPQWTPPKPRAPADPQKEFADAMARGRIWQPVKPEGLEEQCSNPQALDTIFTPLQLIEVRKAAEVGSDQWVFWILDDRVPRKGGDNASPVECTVSNSLFMSYFKHVQNVSELPGPGARVVDGGEMVQRKFNACMSSTPSIWSLSSADRLALIAKCRSIAGQ
jgi:hypothetical protein